ncbi:flagellar assembly protein FliH [Rhodocyclus gracilis]|uniref:Flagellar assembly protein FliH n=1 Tax=Rhodocyclus tenuis TaxID=1066 RepID=A0A6L5JW30_RHOTE|nr:flagellar assembly protein FliH [Rhodocyclus gracilis]MQY51587.1 flagellar assembly protein FliH [Rhodocyclus gracilis]
MSGFTPRGKLTAYQRWELADFDAPEPGTEPAPPLPDAAPAGDDPTGDPAQDGELVSDSGLQLPTAEEIERLHAEAQESGYAAGHAAGLAAGREEGYAAGIAEGREHSARLASALSTLKEALAATEENLAAPLLTLAVDLAGEVLRQSLRIQPELLLPVVREAMATLPTHNGKPVLFLNPADSVLVREHLADTLEHGGWRLMEDATIEAGGCRVEIGASEVDATLQKRWRRVIESIGGSGDWLAPPR